MSSVAGERVKKLSLTVSKDFNNRRLDVFLAGDEQIPSRSRAAGLIEAGLVTVNNNMAAKGSLVHEGDIVEVSLAEPGPLELEPSAVDLKIIYEDQDLIVISKPAGMVVHPSAGHDTGTLVNALLHYTKDLSGIGGIARPGIIHRLDKDTSGLIIVAKNDNSHLSLSAQIAHKKCFRLYTALVSGNIKEDEGFIDAPIGRNALDRKKMGVRGDGKEARTEFSVIERFGDFTLLKVRLTTGRTHQIRVHMSFMKHPIAGDPQYGGKRSRETLGLTRQFLHASAIEFDHPTTGERLTFTDELPDDLESVLAVLRRG